MIDPNFFIHIAQAAETAHEVAAVEPGIAETLGLNVQLFIAQLINFAIVLFVLWKWVFTPITKALQARTQKIEETLQTAENTQKERDDFAEWKKKEISTARSEASEIINGAKSEADALKASLLIETRHEQEAVVEKTRKQIESEKEQAISAIKLEAATLVTTATEAILRQKLDSSKDKELIKSALEQVS